MSFYFTKYRMLVWLLFSYSVISCQSDEDVIAPVDDEIVFTSTSPVFELVGRVSLADGSNDNILDNASCISIELPISIQIGSTSVNVQSDADFGTVENTLRLNQLQQEDIQFTFPITIILPDHSKVDINSSSELTTFRSTCSIDGSDEDLECIDFIYPFSISIFNRITETGEVRSFSADKDLNLFLQTLTQDDLLSIEYPIQLLDSDQSSIPISSNSALENSILQSNGQCDENDDVTFDLTTGSEFITTLTSDDWVATLLFDDGNVTNDVINFTFDFSIDGSIIASDGTTEPGSWLSQTLNDTLFLDIDFDSNSSLVDMRREWAVVTYDNSRIILAHQSGGTTSSEYLIFERTPKAGLTNLETAIINGSWVVAQYLDGDKDETGDYAGFSIDFRTDGSLEATDGTDIITGTWLSVGDIILPLVFDQSPFNQLRDDWNVLQFDANEIMLEVTNDDDEIDKLTLQN